MVFIGVLAQRLLLCVRFVRRWIPVVVRSADATGAYTSERLEAVYPINPSVALLPINRRHGHVIACRLHGTLAVSTLQVLLALHVRR